MEGVCGSGSGECLDGAHGKSTDGQPRKPASSLSDSPAIGVSVSIDDFGTGYSSCELFETISPLTALKIDKSFVRDIPDDADDATIVNATIALAHSLRLRATAEGGEKQVSAGLPDGRRLRRGSGDILSGVQCPSPNSMIGCTRSGKTLIPGSKIICIMKQRSPSSATTVSAEPIRPPEATAPGLSANSMRRNSMINHSERASDLLSLAS